MSFEYNTQQKPLVISEYGRAVQHMVEVALAEPDKAKRTRLAQSIVYVMAQVNPGLKDSTDFKQKLWDHLHIISNFDLDVDRPYPTPEREKINSRPGKVPYSLKNIRYRYYGKTIELMIQKCADMEDGPEKSAYVNAIGSFMKMAYRQWNEDNIGDDVVVNDIYELSKGKLRIEADGEGVHFAAVKESNLRKNTTITEGFQRRNKGGKHNFNKKNNNKKFYNKNRNK